MTIQSAKTNLKGSQADPLAHHIKRFKPLSWSPNLRRIACMTTSIPSLGGIKPKKKGVLWFHSLSKPATPSAPSSRCPTSTAAPSYRPPYMPSYLVYQDHAHAKHFRTETMQNRLSLLLSHALMPRNGTPKPIEGSSCEVADEKVDNMFTATQLQRIFIELGEIVQKLTTVLRFEADEMATTILLAQRLRHVKCKIPIESIRTVAYTCAMMASKHCNDEHYNLDAFAHYLHIQKSMLLKFESVLFNILWTNDEYVVNTHIVEQAIQHIENVDLDYGDVMPPNEKQPIWSISRVQQWEDDIQGFSPAGHDRHPTDLRYMETSPQTAPTTPVRIENDFALPGALNTSSLTQLRNRIFCVSAADTPRPSVVPRVL